MTMQLDIIGWMADFSLKLILSPENIVKILNFYFLVTIVH